MKTADTTRFFALVAPEPMSGCHLWLGQLNDKGYGYFWLGKNLKRASRIAYQLAKGAIPEGLVLDHICRTRACVNADHLEPVTDLVNIRRGIGNRHYHQAKTHCKNGHPYDETTRLEFWDGHFSRRCRQCRRNRQNDKYRKTRSSIEPA